MRIREIFRRNTDDKAYADTMAQVQRQTRPKRIVLTEQCESTKRILAQTEAECEILKYRIPDPIKYITTPPWEIERQISSEEFVLYERMRHKAKNSEGQSTLSAFSEERRAKARDAWYYTKPTDYSPLEKTEIKQLEEEKKKMEKPKEPEVIVLKKPNWFQRLFGKIIEEPKSMIERMSLEEREKWGKNENKS